MQVLLVTAVFRVNAQDEKYAAFSRQDYYTTEETGEIAAFAPASKKEMKVSIDLAFEFEFLVKGAVIFPGHYIPVGFPMSRLHIGDNEITVSFYEDDKWVDSRKVNVVLKEDASYAVKTDLLTGTMLSGGLPFFPVGFYSAWPMEAGQLEEETVKGFNLVSPYWAIDARGTRERLEFMDRCAELGLKVNYNLCSVAGGGGVSSSHGKASTREEKMKLLRREVERMRSHPALLAWYIADEPEGQGVPADSLKDVYDLIKELDPYHPVTIVFMAPRMAGDYAGVMDIAMTDPYPVPHGSVSEVAEYVNVLQGLFRYTKPVWLVPQAFGGNEWWTREPSAQEVRAMSYLGLVSGASGLQYFIRRGPNGSPKSPATWGECGLIAQEMIELLPCLASGHPAPPVIVSGKELYARAINKSGLFYLIVVNTSSNPTEFSLKMEEIDLTIQADVLFEHRQVRMADGTLTDMIDGLGTRIYRLDNRMMTDRMKDFSPGNLVVDPGFEQNSSPGIPAACYISTGQDRGATAFLDGRAPFQGDRSLRLTTPTFGEGLTLHFYGLELDPDRSYSVSVMARSAPDQLPKKRGCGCAGGKNSNTFALFLGKGPEEHFELSTEWERYTFSTAEISMESSLGRWYFPGLSLLSRGTAWLDALQVVPDMEVMNRRGDAGRTRVIELASNHMDSKIVYTLDGSRPGRESTPYVQPVPLDRSFVLRAASYDEKGELNGTISKEFRHHPGIGGRVNYVRNYEKYTASGDDGLVDGVLGTSNYKDGRWQGFHGTDAEFILNLGQSRPVNKVSLNFLQDLSCWIFLPRQVLVSLSTDGVNYEKIVMTSTEVPLDKRGPMIETFSAEFVNSSAKFIKVEARGIGNCPAWHSGAGQPAWIFTDEVVVE